MAWTVVPCVHHDELVSKAMLSAEALTGISIEENVIIMSPGR